MQKQGNWVDQFECLSTKGHLNKPLSQGSSRLLSSQTPRYQQWVDEEEETVGRHGQINRRYQFIHSFIHLFIHLFIFIYLFDYLFINYF